jgi:hypothetical protein
MALTPVTVTFINGGRMATQLPAPAAIREHTLARLREF